MSHEEAVESYKGLVGLINAHTTHMNGIETEQDIREERKVAALERIADSLSEAERIGELEDLLNTFVLLMKTPHSQDEAWQELLERVEEALG